MQLPPLETDSRNENMWTDYKPRSSHSTRSYFSQHPKAYLLYEDDEIVNIPCENIIVGSESINNSDTVNDTSRNLKSSIENNTYRQETNDGSEHFSTKKIHGQ